MNASTQHNASLPRQIYSMTWPMVIGLLSMMSFQLVDSIFIGRLGVEPLAIAGYTIPIYQLIIGFQVGIGIATTALISQHLGAGNEDEAKALATTILAVGSAVIASLSLLIWFFRAQVLSLLGADLALLPLAEELWRIFLISSVVGAFLYFGYSICRAHGNTLLPGIGMVITSLLNIALDPLFIFYFELGLAGAAYATLCSFGLGILLTFPRIMRERWIELCAHGYSRFQHTKAILTIAIPAMTSQMMPAAAAVGATYLVSSFGTEVVAAWGMGTRIEFFSIVLVLALTMSLPPMIGRNFGSGDYHQIDTTVRLAMKFVLGWQLLLAIAGFSFAKELSTVMSGRPEVAESLFWIIVLIPFSYGFLGVCMICVSVCNAIASPQRALWISFARLFMFYLPCLYLGAYFYDEQGLFAGAAIGNVGAGIFGWHLYRQRLNTLMGKT